MVAIAITLLVLPLVDVVAADGGRTRPAELFAGHAVEFHAFLLGVVVIARRWWAHHRAVVRHQHDVVPPRGALVGTPRRPLAGPGRCHSRYGAGAPPGRGRMTA